ncbi:hypothetical protein [Dictyobacter formicarum]|nr:hypothetical protein [Dictyobacter formicarum]
MAPERLSARFSLLSRLDSFARRDGRHSNCVLLHMLPFNRAFS